MAKVEKSIDINVPVRAAYTQWTQFKEFPRFMDGVREVRQIDKKRLHWRAEIDGKEREWDAEIAEQTPDKRISWHSIGGAKNAGQVSFQPLSNSRTRVSLSIDSDLEAFTEKSEKASTMVSGRIQGDLERFKEFIESRQPESGALRNKARTGKRNADPEDSDDEIGGITPGF